MSALNTKIKNLPPKELKEEYTNEFILLGLFYFATKHNLMSLGRMQTVKLLAKFKELAQGKLGLQAYYMEFYKDKHGDFNKEFYNQINNLRTAGFIEFSGTQPLEKYRVSKKGTKVFERFMPEDKNNKQALQFIKSNLDSIITKHGKKTAGILRKENHQKLFRTSKGIKSMDELPEKDEELILSRNLKPSEIRYKFLFDNETTLDWAIAISIGERKKIEEIIPEDLLPRNQKEAYKILGL